jgi:hypothetical protein
MLTYKLPELDTDPDLAENFLSDLGKRSKSDRIRISDIG